MPTGGLKGRNTCPSERTSTRPKIQISQTFKSTEDHFRQSRSGLKQQMSMEHTTVSDHRFLILAQPSRVLRERGRQVQRETGVTLGGH
jgi:hypothetical protein